MKTYLNSAAPVPHALTLTLCWLFVVLFGVWLLPNTVFTRNVCLIAGALLGLLVVVPRWRLLLQKKALPIWLIGALFIWITIHLFYIGLDYPTQLLEYTKSWKKIFIGSVFAVGLGIAIASHLNDSRRLDSYWKIIYFGLMLPMLIYFVKLVATSWAPLFGIELSPFIFLSSNYYHDPFAIHRSGYVFFCLPALAISLGLIRHAILEKINSIVVLIPSITIVMTGLIFYIEGDRLGILFSFFLVGATFSSIILHKYRDIKFKGLIFLLLPCIVVATIGAMSFKSNEQWQSLLSDAKVAVQIEKYQQWKFEELKSNSYKLEKFDHKIGESNYVRIAWATVASKLIIKYPLGYGMMSLSFGRLCKIVWPESETSWSHSAWLDFTLGYGILGFIFLASASFLSWLHSKSLPNPWGLIGSYGLGTIIIVLIVKELSSEIFIGAFIFITLFVAGMVVNHEESFSD